MIDFTFFFLGRERKEEAKHITPSIHYGQFPVCNQPHTRVQLAGLSAPCDTPKPNPRPRGHVCCDYAISLYFFNTMYGIPSNGTPSSMTGKGRRLQWQF
jgi:hypothetical protein